MSHRIIQRNPIVLQGNHIRIDGSVELLVRVDKRGKVTCISVVRGHPLLLSAVIDSVKDWQFRLYRQKDKRVDYSGVLVIHAREFTVP